jgi:hypothetical protein
VAIAGVATVVSIVGGFLLHRAVLRILKDDSKPKP